MALSASSRQATQTVSASGSSHIRWSMMAPPSANRHTGTTPSSSKLSSADRPADSTVPSAQRLLNNGQASPSAVISRASALVSASGRAVDRPVRVIPPGQRLHDGSGGVGAAAVGESPFPPPGRREVVVYGAAKPERASGSAAIERARQRTPAGSGRAALTGRGGAVTSALRAPGYCRSNGATSAVQPVWWAAPKPLPVSPSKNS